MIADAFAAAEQIFTRPFRTVFWKVLASTVLILAFCGVGLERLVIRFVVLPHAAWVATFIHAAAGLGIAAAMVFLIGPVSFVVAGFFFDELAEHVEAASGGVPGRAMPLLPATWLGVKFGLLSLAVNAVALLLLLVPGVNAVAFFGANAYLFGRGFFELAVLRHRSPGDMRALRRRHGLRILVAGGVCAALAAVPVVNLLTPLFATALLVRVAQPVLARRLPYRAV